MNGFICLYLVFASLSLWSDRAIILMGAPGSGKGTQATLLRERLQWPHISIGTVMRAYVARQNELSAVLQQYEYNETVNRPLKIGLMMEAIADAYLQSHKKELILDAWPKDLRTLQLLKKTVFRKHKPIVIELVAQKEELETRVARRSVCPNPSCGKPFGLGNPPPQDNVCDTCGYQLQRRTNEEGDAFYKRVENYEKRYLGILEAYRSLDIPWHTIIANASVEEIHQQIMSIVEKGGMSG